MQSAIVQLKLALRNARRNIRRTLLTATTVMIGTGLATLTISFMNGYVTGFMEAMQENHGDIRIVTQAYYDRETLRPLYENVEGVEALRAELLARPDVARVNPVIRTGVILAPGEEIGDDFGMLVGAEPDWYERSLDAPDKVIRGQWLSDEAGLEEIVIGRKVAQDLGIEVGQEILVMGQSQYGSMSPMSPTVVGIVSHNGLLDAQIYMDLEALQWMVDIEDGTIELLVYGEDSSVAGVKSLQADLAALPSLQDHHLRPFYEEEFMAQIIPVMAGMNFFIAGLMLFVMVLAIFNTMTMSVLERTGEIGVMRAMGQTRVGAVVLFIVEAATIGAIGGILGTTLGGLAGYYFEVNGVNLGQDLVDQAGGNMPISAVIYGDVSPDILIQCLLLGLFTAALGALLPALRAASISPSQAMRARR